MDGFLVREGAEVFPDLRDLLKDLILADEGDVSQVLCRLVVQRGVQCLHRRNILVDQVTEALSRVDRQFEVRNEIPDVRIEVGGYV